MASAVKQHIITALADGTQAGFDSWFAALAKNTNNGTNGLQQLQDLYAAVVEIGGLKTRGRNKGTFKRPSQALRFYCNKYADELGQTPSTIESTPTTPTPAPVVETIATPTTDVDVTSLLTAAITAGANPEQLAAIVTAANSGGNGVGSIVEVEEDDEDEEANVCPPFEGKDPGADASSGQLYTLNALGLLTPHFTKGEAHVAIWTAKNA
jgi:hypothetical protein